MSRPAPTDIFSELATGLLNDLELIPRARQVVQSVAGLLPGSAVVLYTLEGEPAQTWIARAVAGEVIRPGATLPRATGALGQVYEQRRVLGFRAEHLPRSQHNHLDIRQELAALWYVPLVFRERLMGCLEVLSYRHAAFEQMPENMPVIAEAAAVAIQSARTYEAERNAGLAAVSRMAQLYDIEKIFCATLEMNALLPVICGKVKELTEAGVVNLWMVDADQLKLMEQAGVGSLQKPGDRTGGGTSLIEQIAEDGEPRLSPAVSDEPSADLSLVLPEMSAGLIHDGSLVGVLQAVRPAGRELYTEDDLFVLTQVADSAAQALHNSSLLEAERKIATLQLLVSISQEITSTLNQQQVLRAIVDQPHRLFEYERCALALEDRMRLHLRAVSGKERCDESSPELALLLRVLEWVTALEMEVHVVDHGGVVNDPRPETREKFRGYFDQTGMRGFYALPLADEQGRLGVLSFESSDPDFLSELHIESIKLLAGQATVALRNATLFKEVPFIGLLEPMLQKKRRLLATARRRRMLALATLAAVLLLLLPVPLRLSGDALVGPSQTQSVRAEQDGVVSQVFVQEGETVPAGTALVQMADWTQRADLASVQARYNTAQTEAARALVANDPTVAGEHQQEANYLQAEMTRTQEQLARTTIHTVLPGTVTTPHTEDLIGRRVLAGDPLLEMVSTAEMMVDVAVSQRDVLLLHPGEEVRIKLEALPLRTLKGRVVRVSNAAEVEGSDRVFYARVTVANPQGRIRPGMQGLAKINVGLRPLGVWMLRTPTLWAWSKLWSWFSW